MVAMPRADAKLKVQVMVDRHEYAQNGLKLEMTKSCMIKQGKMLFSTDKSEKCGKDRIIQALYTALAWACDIRIILSAFYDFVQSHIMLQILNQVSTCLKVFNSQVIYLQRYNPQLFFNRGR